MRTSPHTKKENRKDAKALRLPLRSLRLCGLFFSLLLLACGNDKPSRPHEADSTKPEVVITEDTSSIDGFTFKVADVKPASAPLEMHDMEYVLESRIGKKIFTFPEAQAKEQLIPVRMNGFVQAVQYSYAEHRPLVITPDAIWLLLCQGFSIHVNEHFDSLKTKIFRNDKPVDLLVRNDSLVTGKSAQWQSLLTNFTNQAKYYTNDDVYGTVVQQFSTTTPVERTAYEITLLELQQKAFNYIAESGCGIPEITLKGKISDWERIDSCIDGFRRFGLGEWVDNLHPVLGQFIEARKGNVDKTFWNALYKEASMYGAFYISGWIVKLFPYVREKEFAGEMETYHYLPNPFFTGDDYCLSTLSTDNFPGGFAKISVQWNNPLANPDETTPMLVYAGFFGIRQYGNKALEPVISWAVCEKEAPVVQHDNFIHGNETFKHTPDRWWPEIDDKADRLPLYGTCKSYAQSTTLLTKYLQDTLTLINKTDSFAAHAATVNFVVTWAGTVTQVFVRTASPDPRLEQEIEYLIATLPQSWKPAIRMLEYDDSEKGGKEATRVNYRVPLQLRF